MRVLLSSLLVLLTSCYSYAQKTTTLDFRGETQIELSYGKLSYYELNPSNEAPKAQTLHYKALQTLYPNFGFTKNDVWFRFILSNPEDRKVFLKISNPNLDEIDVFSTNSLHTIAQLGDKRNKSLNRYPNRENVTFLLCKTGISDTFYLRINNGGEQFHFVPSIVTENYFLIEEPKSQSIFGIYFGIILFIVIFNLFSFFSLGERTALWYALYAFLLGMLQISLNGFGNQYMWSGEYLSNRANPFFASSSVLFLLLFVMDYLKTRIILPKIHKLLIFILVSIALCVLLSLIPSDFTYEISVIGINGITLLLNLLIIPIAFISYRKGGLEQAKLFILAFSLLIFSVFGFILKNFGILPSNFFTDNGMLLGSAAESILLSIGIVLKYKKTREEAVKNLEKINQVTEEANQILEQKVIERTKEVELQKAELSYKNKEILSSISYAKRIQEALIPSENEFKRLFPKATVWYAPKDIVAVDFYWLKEIQTTEGPWKILAVADCTGHGVPGAMMSVLCMNSLELACAELQKIDTGIILDRTSLFLKKSLTKEDKVLQDGMDISILAIHEASNTCIWSGANNALWVFNDSENYEIQADKKPIGNTEITSPFTTHHLHLKPKDRLFLYTDGYADQFGGQKLKKLKRKGFQDQILQSMSSTSKEQLIHLKNYFSKWKGTEEQVDDVCLLILEW
jgi:serine phosphatase RsbU (regulator of sigma subunit)